MGKRKPTNAAPIRRSKRRVNAQQKCIPIESLLNTEPEIDVTESNSLALIFKQESSDPVIPLVDQVQPPLTLSGDTSITQPNTVFYETNDQGFDFSPIKQEPGFTIIHCATETTPTAIDNISVGSPTVIQNEIPVTSNQDTMILPGKRKRTVVDYQESLNYNDFEEDEYIASQARKKSISKKKPAKKVNTSTNSSIDIPSTSMASTATPAPKPKPKPKSSSRVYTKKAKDASSSQNATPKVTKATIPKTTKATTPRSTKATTPKTTKRAYTRRTAVPKDLNLLTESPNQNEIVPQLTEAVYHSNTEEEVNETQLADKQLPTPPENEYNQEALRFILQDKASYLATAELKNMIPELLSALPQEDLNELAVLLPYTDKVADGSISVSFASPSNNFFWEAVNKWQDVLYLGGFDEKKLANKKGKGKAQEDTSFKDDNYEHYWGERLKRDQETKEQRAKKIPTRKRK